MGLIGETNDKLNSYRLPQMSGMGKLSEDIFARTRALLKDMAAE